MLSAIGVALCLFPMITKFSRKYGKKTMLVIASVVFTVVFAFIYFADKLAALVVGYELYLGLSMGVVVAFPFAAINILPQSCMSDIIQKDSIENGVNREGFFSATKTFIEKIAYSMAMVVVSSVLAIGAPLGESVGTQGVKLTGVFAGLFSLLSLICFLVYDEKSVTAFIARHREKEVKKG
jgi:Na+/melibiose symporter-like transporter